MVEMALPLALKILENMGGSHHVFPTWISRPWSLESPSACFCCCPQEVLADLDTCAPKSEKTEY